MSSSLRRQATARQRKPPTPHCSSGGLQCVQDHDYDCVPDTRWGVGSEGWMPSPSLRVSERVQILWVVGGWAQTRPLPGLVHVGCVVGGLFLSLSYLQSG